MQDKRHVIIPGICIFYAKNMTQRTADKISLTVLCGGNTAILYQLVWWWYGPTPPCDNTAALIQHSSKDTHQTPVHCDVTLNTTQNVRASTNAMTTTIMLTMCTLLLFCLSAVAAATQVGCCLDATRTNRFARTRKKISKTKFIVSRRY